MSVGERKLIVMLLGCVDLPPQQSTNTNNSMVTMRLVERSYTNAANAEDLAAGRLITMVRSGATDAVVKAVRRENRHDAIAYDARKQAVLNAGGGEGGGLDVDLFVDGNIRGTTNTNNSNNTSSSKMMTTIDGYTTINSNATEEDDEVAEGDRRRGNKGLPAGPTSRLARKATAAGMQPHLVDGGSGSGSRLSSPPTPSSSSMLPVVTACPIPLGPLHRIERVLGNATIASPIMRQTSNPCWEEIFVFEDLAIPYYYSYGTSGNTIEARMAAVLGAMQTKTKKRGGKRNTATAAMGGYGGARGPMDACGFTAGDGDHSEEEDDGDDGVEDSDDDDGDTCDGAESGNGDGNADRRTNASSSSPSNRLVAGGAALATGRPRRRSGEDMGALGLPPLPPQPSSVPPSPSAKHSAAPPSPYSTIDAFGAPPTPHTTKGGGGSSNNMGALVAVVPTNNNNNNNNSTALLHNTVLTTMNPNCGKLRLSPAFDDFGRKLRMPSEFTRAKKPRGGTNTSAAAMGGGGGGRPPTGSGALSGSSSPQQGGVPQQKSLKEMLREQEADLGGGGGGNHSPNHQQLAEEGAIGGVGPSSLPTTARINNSSVPPPAIAGGGGGDSPSAASNSNMTFKELLNTHRTASAASGARGGGAAAVLTTDDTSPLVPGVAPLAAHAALGAAVGTDEGSNHKKEEGDGGEAADAANAQTDSANLVPTPSGLLMRRGGANNTATSATASLSPSQQEALELRRLEEALLVERQFFLELQVRDTTHTAGWGDLVASFAIQVDLLPMTLQSEIWGEMAVNHRNATLKLPPSTSALAGMGGRGSDTAINPLLSAVGNTAAASVGGAAPPPPPPIPQIGIVLEPVNFGSVPNTGAAAAAVTGAAGAAAGGGGSSPTNSNVPLPATPASAAMSAPADGTAAHLSTNPLAGYLKQHQQIMKRRLQASGQLPLDDGGMAGGGGLLNDEDSGFLRDPIDLIKAKRGLGMTPMQQRLSVSGASSSGVLMAMGASGNHSASANGGGWAIDSAGGHVVPKADALTYTLSLLTRDERMELMLSSSLSPNARPLAHLVMEELGDTFRFEFISEVISILLYVDEQTDLTGLGKEEMHTLLQELYTYTGTSLPTDVNLAEELRYLFNTFDRDHDEVLTVQEVCNVLRSSQLRINLNPKWKVGIAAGPWGLGGGNTNSTAANANGTNSSALLSEARSTYHGVGGGAAAAASLRSSRNGPSSPPSQQQQLSSTMMAQFKGSDASAMSTISTFNKPMPTTAGSLADPRNVVSAASVAGCLWSESVPQPFSYVGFRLPSGKPHDGSLKPSIQQPIYSQLVPYAPAVARDLFDEVYGDDVKPYRDEDGSLHYPPASGGGHGVLNYGDGVAPMGGAPSSPPSVGAANSQQRRFGGGGGGGGRGSTATSTRMSSAAAVGEGDAEDADAAAAKRRAEGQTIPLFERNKPLSVPFKVKTHAQQVREREQLEQLFSSHRVRRRPTDKHLPHTAGERLSNVAMESVSLNACIVDHSLLVGCRITSGRYTNCTFESCLITSGATIVSPIGGMRSCRVENSKVWSATVFNCKLIRSLVEDCKYVAQSTLQGCTMRSVSIYHCFVSDVSLDPTISDGGANIIEGCRVEDIPKMSYAEKQLDL